MMNQMSYRDKMILLIMTVIIILVAGVFALIKPKYEELVADRNTYNDTLSEWEGIDMKIQQIPVLQKGIKEAYQDAKSIADMFVNEIFVNDSFDSHKANMYLEQYMNPIIAESELKVETAAIQGVKSESLNYYYYEPDVLTYSLLENADINGGYAAELTELLKESTYLSSRDTAQVMVNSYELKVKGGKENLMTFLTKIQEDKNAVLVTDVTIENYTFKEEQTQTPSAAQPTVDEEGNEIPAPAPTPVTASVDADSSMTLTLTFYNATPIDEPDVGE